MSAPQHFTVPSSARIAQEEIFGPLLSVLSVPNFEEAIRVANGTDYALTGEALPYIGAHRNFPFHLFAFGDSSLGVTGAYFASRLFLRQHLGEATPQDEAFGFLR